MCLSSHSILLLSPLSYPKNELSRSSQVKASHHKHGTQKQIEKTNPKAQTQKDENLIADKVRRSSAGQTQKSTAHQKMLTPFSLHLLFASFTRALLRASSRRTEGHPIEYQMRMEEMITFGALTSISSSPFTHHPFPHSYSHSHSLSFIFHLLSSLLPFSLLLCFQLLPASFLLRISLCSFLSSLPYFLFMTHFSSSTAL